jgi:cell division protein FtsZ
MGKAMMGTGEAEGEDRAIQAAEKAIANPLLDEISLRGAKGVLINITGGEDLTLFELDEAANRIREEVDPEANIIVGSTLDTNMGGTMRVSVVATGIDATDVQTDIPVPRRSMREPLKQPQKVAEEQPIAAETRVVAELPSEPEEEDQGGLFEDLDEDRVAAEDRSEDLFGQNASDDQYEDDLPPPAYRPQVAAFEPRQEDELEADQEAYVAPRAPAPGTPSPEAIARLRAAAQKAAPQPERSAAAGDPRRPLPATEKPRFGINSLINRMTGHGEGEGQQHRPARQQPPVQQHRAAAAPQPQQDHDDDEERIEIPAFLRRQAN